MKCVHCGAQVPETAKFCFNCGEKIQQSTVSASHGECPACWVSNSPTARFCRSCGAPLSTKSKSELEELIPAALCPNCGSALKKVPQKKTICPNCRKPMYIRRRPSDRKRVLVTQEQADEIERQWAVESVGKTYPRKAYQTTQSAATAKKNKSGVPEWLEYYPSLSQATPEQQRFYEFWRDNFERGITVDVDGNLSYIFVYIYSVIERFLDDKDINHLLAIFERLRTSYSGYDKIRDYPRDWAIDAWLCLGNYDEAWALVKTLPRPLSIFDVVNIKAKCIDTKIDGHDLLDILGHSCLTSFGNDHLEEIAKLVTIFLRDFHKEYGKNFIEYFCSQFKLRNLTEDDFAKLEPFFPDPKGFRALKKSGTYVAPSCETRLFSGVPTNSSLAVTIKVDPLTGEAVSELGDGKILDLPTIEEQSIPYIVRAALTNKGRQIVRECENTFREESNVPKIGDGWIRETELFYRLCDAFPDAKVIHHGRPSWLSPQHLDIYFPDNNVGCEFQGAQHQNAVEYFGGEESFKEQQARDERKKRLCRRHGCKLLYVFEDDNFETVRLTVEKMLTD